jgi:hypothetical protein
MEAYAGGIGAGPVVASLRSALLEPADGFGGASSPI